MLTSPSTTPNRALGQQTVVAEIEAALQVQEDPANQARTNEG